MPLRYNLSSMKASEVEFRYRFWFIGAIFAVGFWLYIVDRYNASQSLALPLSKVDGISADLNTRIIFWIAAALALLAALLRTWATAYLRAEVMVDTTVRTERLVADGPYRFVRNPLYLANILLACAMATMASRVGAVVIVLGMMLFSLRLINREEGGLALSQGESYRHYLATVPCLLPSVTPRLPASGAKPHWGQAMAGEMFMWAFSLSVVAFAATLDMRIYWIVLALGFISYGISRTMLAKKRKDTAVAGR